MYVQQIHKAAFRLLLALIDFTLLQNARSLELRDISSACCDVPLLLLSPLLACVDFERFNLMHSDMEAGFFSVFTRKPLQLSCPSFFFSFFVMTPLSD